MADYGLKIQPCKKPVRGAWKMPVFSNSNYARDIAETRISMTGFCVFLMGVPSSWKSHAQRSMTLSSSKAEFVALFKATKNIKFIVQVLLSIGIRVKLSVIVQVDNIRGILWQRMWVQIPGPCMLMFATIILENSLRMVLSEFFIWTGDNKADVFTKNVVEDIW